MKILVINGDYIQKNTSANLCHLAYIRGLVDSGHEVTLLSADGRNYEQDPSMIIPEMVNCHTYYGVSLYERLSLHKKKTALSAETAQEMNISTGEKKRFNVIRSFKKMVFSLYGVHGIYAKFVRKAQKFHSDTEYDYVLSLSTPVTSHLIAYNLIRAGHIRCKQWIQIWEDPWYSDAYGFNRRQEVYLEEKRLLSFAEKVCYVSPLTLRNQQLLFPEFAVKMFWQPVPSYYLSKDTGESGSQNTYGYFGDYSPVARNLEPFYSAAKETGISVTICGNPSNLFSPTERIQIYPRLSVSDLTPMEENTSVLVFLCNKQGGQIPGKIYQYSATYKTILFILDGTEEEKTVLKKYFSQFNRYVFCENTKEDIIRAIKAVESGEGKNISNRPIDEFEPQKIISRILKGE